MSPQLLLLGGNKKRILFVKMNYFSSVFTVCYDCFSEVLIRFYIDFLLLYSSASCGQRRSLFTQNICSQFLSPIGREETYRKKKHLFRNNNYIRCHQKRKLSVIHQTLNTQDEIIYFTIFFHTPVAKKFQKVRIYILNISKFTQSIRQAG